MFMKIAELEVLKKEFDKLTKEQQLKCVDVVKRIKKNSWARVNAYSSINCILFKPELPFDFSPSPTNIAESIETYIHEMIGKTELEKCCKADGVDYFQKWDIERLRGKVKC